MATEVSVHGVTKTNQQQKGRVDRLLDQDELELAMKDLKFGKSPGLDGFPVEYYRAFWEQLKVAFYHTIQECIYTDKRLHLSACRCVIALLERDKRKFNS